MKFKNLAKALTIATMIMMLTACGNKETTNEVTPTPTEAVTAEVSVEPTAEPTPTLEVVQEGMVRSYLTGEYVPEAVGRRRPVAIMMNNVKVAVPQAGIANAGVVYEAPVEGGITRLMAVIEDYDNLEKIGSMRSCRDYYIFYASGFNAIYVHYGQSVYALGILEMSEVDNLSGLSGYSESVFYRTSDRKAPHNAYTSYEGLQRGIEIRGYSQEYAEGYQSSYVFADASAPIELPGEWWADVVLPGYYLNDARFDYNAEDGLYYRSQYGGAHIDELTGEQLAYKNILIQYSTWRNYDENGYLNIDVDAGNEGVYITNGKAIPVRWEKHDPWGATFYYDMAGNQITLNQGKTWVCIVQDTMRDRVSVKGHGDVATAEAVEVIEAEAIGE
jgi:Protein of unknown function (DUF3048).